MKLGLGEFARIIQVETFVVNKQHDTDQIRDFWWEPNLNGMSVNQMKQMGLHRGSFLIQHNFLTDFPSWVDVSKFEPKQRQEHWDCSATDDVFEFRILFQFLVE